MSVENLSLGRRVGGAAAPTKKGFEKWMAKQEHAGWAPTEAWVAANLEWVESEVRRGAAWAQRVFDGVGAGAPHSADESAPPRGKDGATSNEAVPDAGG